MIWMFLIFNLLAADRSNLIPIKKEAQKPKLLLFEMEKQETQQAQKESLAQSDLELIPKRVYWIYLDSEKRWFQTLTDFDGNLSQPLEVLLISSVLEGKYLGAKNPKQNYLAKGKGRWAATYKRPYQDFWVFDKVPFMKTIEYLSLAEAGL